MSDSGGHLPVKKLLSSLDVGSSVAEHDADLERYFVETATFRQLIEDRGDIVAGDKGTGKTALYRILKERYAKIPELAKVEVIPAFNPQGTPIFQRILEADTLDEGQYIGVWKAYYLSLAGNWLLGVHEGDFTPSMDRLDKLLQGVGLRSTDDSARSVFGQLVEVVKKFLRPRAAEQSVTFSQDGMPIITHRVEFDDDPAIKVEQGRVRHDDALRLLNDALEEADLKLWLVMDRLDEAFQGKPEHERPALRALFRTYLEMLEFSNVRVKLFVRRDLFARMIEGGFVNLTHINARRIEIVWDEEDLYALLYRRITESDEFVKLLGIGDGDANAVFDIVFPDQVDQGDRKPKTWKWIMSRVRDGNYVRPPRNLIDLVLKAQDSQLRAEDRDARTYSPGTPLITGESLKRGLDALSKQRVEDTLLAEAGDNAKLIELFRDGKAEHNTESLAGVFGSHATDGVKVLQTLGFIEQTGSTYKIPMLYRSGLNITQGRAFASATGGTPESEDED
ncbi:hypothetical protein KV102_07630 [Mumia sp. zg.B53]|uniref:P-loop ATPase, Sll1717 family n=1 Tax=Mumia sp. zg.B53 TaxID=2855449 RepID=UPI001C6E4DC2|nr:hypothetical protein [Mumia sp. zg.B53]MBW9214713.1 hypothetical protein [Mumia sp. zg.B53]